MGIQHIPGFWGQLGQGLLAGQQSFNQARDRQREDEELAYRHKMDQLGLMSNLFQSGAINASALNAAGQNAGMQLNAQPNQAQRQRELIGRKPLSISIPGMGPMGSSAQVSVSGANTASDDEREAAGLPTIAERQSKILGNQKTRQDIAGGAQDIEQSATQEIERKYGGDATRFVSQAAGAAGGQVTGGNIQQVAQAAFQQYVKARAQANNPVPQGEIEPLRAYFGKAAMDLYNTHEALRIKLTDATTFANGAGSDPTVKLAGQISARMNNINGRMKLLQGSMPFMIAQANQSTGKATPEDLKVLSEYMALGGELENLNAAHAKLMEGGPDARAQAAAMVAGVQTTGPTSHQAPAQGLPTVNPSDTQINQSTHGGKRKVSADQKAYLQSIGKWDSSKYEVVP